MNEDLYEMNNKLLAFCEKYKDEIPYDDLNNFHELWSRIYNNLFEVSTEEICRAINCDEGFSDNYFVYTTEEDRDFYYKENEDVPSNI